MINKKLGKLAPRHDVRTLKFVNYLALPAAPTRCNWATKVKSWPMMLNDQIGDCAIASPGHMVQAWTANETGTAAIIPNKQILAAYSAISGYDPKTGDNDNGCVMLDVLNYWKRTGIGGHKISAFMSVTPTNHTLVKEALWLFGAVNIGVALPISAQNQTGPGLKWTVPKGGATGDGEPGSWGGHAIPIISYDSTGLLVVTWGELQFMTWGFLNTYCDEAYACLATDWTSKGKSPSGFNFTQLQADLAGL